MEPIREFSYYKSKTNLFRHPSASFSSVKLRVSADNYYNPLGPCGSPNRLSDDVIGPDVPCEGLEMTIDNYRLAEDTEVVDKGKVLPDTGGSARLHRPGVGLGFRDSSIQRRNAMT